MHPFQWRGWGRFRVSACLKLGQKSLDFLVWVPSRKNPISSGSCGGGSTSASGGDFFLCFFFQIPKKLLLLPLPLLPYGFDFDKKPRREKGLELHFRCSDCAPLVVPVLLHVLTRAMGPNARALERLY